MDFSPGRFSSAGVAGILLENAAIDGIGLKSTFEKVAQELDAVAFHLVDLSDQNSPQFIVADVFQALYSDYSSQAWYLRDTWTRNASSRQYSGMVINSQDLIPDSVRGRDPFFQEFCRGWGFDQFVSWTFELAGRRYGYSVMLDRNREIDSDYLSAVERLVPMANRAVFLASYTSEIRAQGMANGLEASGRPTIILDNLGRVSFVTSQARRYIGVDFDIREGHLVGFDAREDAAMRVLTRRARRGGTGALGNFLIRRNDGRRPIVAMPVILSDPAEDLLPGARLLLALVDLADIESPSLGSVGALFQLTLAEAEVVGLIAMGLSPSQCADARNVGPETIRSQMKSIFRKMDVNRQIDVVRIVDRIGRLQAP